MLLFRRTWFAMPLKLGQHASRASTGISARVGAYVSLSIRELSEVPRPEDLILEPLSINPAEQTFWWYKYRPDVALHKAFLSYGLLF